MRGLPSAPSLLPFVGLLFLAACDRDLSAGDACERTDGRCKDPKTELVCQTGRLIEAPCRGPEGCREGQTTLSCDVSENREGDPCSTDDDGHAQCRTDRTALVRCTTGVYRVVPCRGPEACRDGNPPTCDQSKGREGDPCLGSTHACSMDGRRLLRCADGTFQDYADCSGAEGCRVREGSVQCDQREQPEGTPP